MATIKKYTDKQGNTKYEFRMYAGINQQTGKENRVHRRGFNSAKSAQLALSRLMLDVDQKGAVEKDNNILFSQVYHEWYEQYINTVRESTWARTDAMFQNHILPAFGKLRIRTITIDQVQRAVNKWFKFAPVNYMKWYHYVCGVFEFAIKRGYMNGPNPGKMITVPKKKEEYGDVRENFWSKEQLEQFFDCLDQKERPEEYALFRLMAFTGMRRGEVLALKWQNLNLTKKTIKVNTTLTQGKGGKQIFQPPKTNKGRHTIVLDDKTISVLKHWRTAQKRKYMLLGINTMNKDQLIFANYKNKPKLLGWPGKRLAQIIKVNGLKKISPHGFRHTHASLLFASGLSIKEVQDRLGDADVETVLNVYTHVTQKQNEEAVQKLVNYVGF